MQDENPRRLVARSVAALATCGGLAAVAVGCDSPALPPLTTPKDRIIWRAVGEGSGMPVFDSMNVYFLGPNHDLVAVDRQSGLRHWSQTTGEVLPGTSARYAALAGDVVAFGDVDIYAYDRVIGEPRWTFRPAEASQPAYLGISSDGRAIYAGSPFGYVYALHGATGAVRWSTRLVSDSNAWMSHPIVSQERVFVCITHKTTPFTGAVAAFDALTGKLVWLREFPPQDPTRPAGCYAKVTVAGSYVLAPSDNGYVYALDRDTGAIEWTLAPDGTLPVVAAVDTLAFVGTDAGYVRALHVRTGLEVWRATSHFGSITSPLAADARRVYALYAGGQLFALDAETGAIVWDSAARPPDDAEYRYTPAVDSDRLYIGGIHGLYALRKD